MKKIIFYFLVIISFTTISCTDYTDPKVLSGTTWRCSSFPDYLSDSYEYIDLQFISTSQVDAWQKPKDGALHKSETPESYIVSGKNITIGSGTEAITGTIENKKMSLLFPSGQVTLIFTKQ